MRKYTKEDFENFEVVNGYRICPSGDYTQIKEFGDKCKFSMDCVFGEGTSFGDSCSFGECCSFGDGCSFGECCDFKRNCSFGLNCSFGKNCSFGICCHFEWNCHFGQNCEFKENCRFRDGCCFGENCKFGKHCSIEGIKFKKFLKFEGFGSEKRCTYFFLTEDNKIYVRCGCFSGYIDEFRNKVTKTHENNFYAQGYLKVAELAEWQLKNDLEG